jgi:hypothetical protein
MMNESNEAQRKEREKIVMEKVKEEDMIAQEQLEGVKEWVWELLINKKNFHPEEIKIDPQFSLKLSDCETMVSIDYVINLNSMSFMVIKCSSSSIESWERYTKAFARVVQNYQIPYAMVTDGENAKIFDMISGSIIGTSVHELFNRQAALDKIKDYKKIPFPPEKLEREKRIAYAFEGIKCPTTKQ